jgi:hypothetical protein
MTKSLETLLTGIETFITKDKPYYLTETGINEIHKLIEIIRVQNKYLEKITHGLNRSGVPSSEAAVAKFAIDEVDKVAKGE